MLHSSHVDICNLKITHILRARIGLFIRVRIQLVVTDRMSVSPISVAVTIRVSIPVVPHNGLVLRLQQDIAGRVFVQLPVLVGF